MMTEAQWLAEASAYFFAKYGLRDEDIEKWWLQGRFPDQETPQSAVDAYAYYCGMTPLPDFAIIDANRAMARWVFH